MGSGELLMNPDCASSSLNIFDQDSEDMLRRGKLAGRKMEMDDSKLYFQSREVGSEDSVKLYGFTDVLEKHDKMRSVLISLRNVTSELFRKVREEIELAIVGSISESSSEKQLNSLLHSEIVLEFLKTKIDTVLSDANDVLKSSAAAIYNSQLDRDLIGELGDLVMQTALGSQFEENKWKHDSLFRGNHSSIWLDKLNEVYGLFTQLDAIVKSLPIGVKSLFEESKPGEESSIYVTESYDYKALSHLSNEELVSYFNAVIATMKRDHESAMQQQIEKYFVLKREYSKEMGSSVAHWRSSEFDVVRKRIPEVITKLEDFISRNRASPAVIGDIENEEKLKGLHQENRSLGDHIDDVRGDVKSVDSQASVEIARKHESNDFDFDFTVTEGLSNLIILEATRDAELNLKDLQQKLEEEKQSGMLFEARSRDLENELRTEVEEKKKLSQETLELRTLVEEKDKLLVDLRDQASKVEKLATVKHVELESLRAQLAEALKQIDDDEMEVLKLYQKLDQAKEALKRSHREREVAFSQAQERHNDELKNVMDKIIGGFRGLSNMFDDFEFKVSEAMRKNHLSLENTSSHLKALANTSRSGLIYEERLKRKCANLKMAEAEVDLLGDEVEALVRLLEKIYIALYHYSPILKHYPGIVEILELVRLELHGESPKLSFITR